MSECNCEALACGKFRQVTFSNVVIIYSNEADGVSRNLDIGSFVVEVNPARLLKSVGHLASF